MTSITYRTTGSWGAGKGANLTPAEVDGNFYDLEQRLGDLESNPPQAVSIASIDVVAGQLIVTLTDLTTHGAFPLPVASMRWAGEWQPSTVYFKNDFLTHDGNLYLVQVAHTSEVVFDDTLFADGGFVYNLILRVAQQPYDIGMYHGFEVPGDGSILLQHVAAREFVLGSDFGDSSAFLNVAVSTEDLVFPVYRNDQLIGHIEFNIGVDVLSPNGQRGTFVQSPMVETQFYRGERLAVLAPGVTDATASGLAITFAARAGFISP